MGSAKTWFKRDDDGTWRVVLFMLLLPIALFAMLWAANAASDSGRVPAALAAAAQESGVMLCADGTIDHGDSLLDRAFQTRNRRQAWQSHVAHFPPHFPPRSRRRPWSGAPRRRARRSRSACA